MTSQPQDEQVSLADFFKEVAAIGHLSERQQQELLAKLEGAITLNLVGKLLDQLSEQDRKQIEQKTLKTNEELFQFLSQAIPQEGFRRIASQSIEEVMKKFLEKI